MKNNLKVGIVPKIVMTIGMVIIFALGALYYYESFVVGELSFFTSHFLIGIVLAIIGCFAIYMPTVSQKSYSGDDRGDKMMFVIGLILFLCAIISIIVSFI